MVFARDDKQLLLAELQGSDTEKRREAAIRLGTLGDTSVRPALMQALRDRDIRVRYNAVHALGELGIGEAVDAVAVVALGDGHAGVRAAATQALGKARQPRIVAILAEALRDTEWSVRGSAATALGMLGDPEAIHPLSLALRDISADVRFHAASALGVIGHREAIPALVQALDDEVLTVQTACADALEKINTAESLAAALRWRERGV